MSSSTTAARPANRSTGTPPQTYNNLLLAYFEAERFDDALALVPIALKTAEDMNNSHTFHNAACVLTHAGRLDEAFDCVRRAKAADYPLMDKIQSDDDLFALHDHRGGSRSSPRELSPRTELLRQCSPQCPTRTSN